MHRFAAPLTFALFFVSCTSAAESALNEKIAGFAKSKLGKKVGDGECSTLADEALTRTRAKERATYPEKPGSGDYVWGELVYSSEVKSGKQTTEGEFKNCKPGDIIQFRNTRFEGRKDRGTYWLETPHHTAILAAISKDGETITVLHQNWDHDKTVHEQAFILKDLKKGWLRFYRPKE